MPQIVPLRLLCAPGIKRDGTELEGNNCIDAKWTRWQRGLPRSMGGYRRITNRLGGIARGINVFQQNNSTYTHLGYSDTLQRLIVDPTGVVSSVIDRTPAAFTTSANNLWQFAQIYDGGTTDLTVLAHAAPNLLDIASDTTAPVYYGNAVGTGVLTATSATNVSGGVTVFHPYAFAFGSNGIVYWSVPNAPNDWTNTGSGSARITASKVVAGMPLRAGAGNAPSGLFWSLDKLIRATFVGGTAIFQFDEITVQSSLLSSQGIIEYDGVYFWCGVDRFLLYNGVVRELPNDMNINYFFDNLNYTYRQKVFAYKVPRYGEIWWCYPRGSATECDHAIVYNVRENTWYDTPLPNSGRSCGQYAQVFRSPLMAGVDVDTSTGSNTYKLWQHEFGTDELDGHDVRAVEKYFETAEFGFPAADDPALSSANSNKSIIVNRIEPDFVQTMDMDLIVKWRTNARAPLNISAPYTFPATASNASEQTITIKENGRFMRFRFVSNITGGSYQMGKPLLHVQEGNDRVTS